jgi:hypothetical protein
MHTESLPRRALAEGLGSALLAATVVGSGIMAQRLAGGNDHSSWRSWLERLSHGRLHACSFLQANTPREDTQPP